MTVIAWDGRTLAADKRAVFGGNLILTTTKIFRVYDAQQRLYRFGRIIEHLR